MFPHDVSCNQAYVYAYHKLIRTVVAALDSFATYVVSSGSDAPAHSGTRSISRVPWLRRLDSPHPLWLQFVSSLRFMI